MKIRSATHSDIDQIARRLEVGPIALRLRDWSLVAVDVQGKQRHSTRLLLLGYDEQGTPRCTGIIGGYDAEQGVILARSASSMELVFIQLQGERSQSLDPRLREKLQATLQEWGLPRTGSPTA